ncbi:hypothetical protein ATANTOWER_032804 [Ataeniobius toweri]|uniref:Uncharacterized protein n=1 Tax=Ataeniobius toweri TaxID=208326 RepID=A0ABU7CDK2_9TELE|nr:hypothetical protein [Ataeniobius toweri]
MFPLGWRSIFPLKALEVMVHPFWPRMSRRVSLGYRCQDFPPEPVTFPTHLCDGCGWVKNKSLKSFPWLLSLFPNKLTFRTVGLPNCPGLFYSHYIFSTSAIRGQNVAAKHCKFSLL